MEKENDKVADMFKYIRHLPESKACGFECHVDEWDALAWVLVNRPHLVTLAQAL